jgi:glycosyltransferase involved in cell wall biosynthesis
MLMKTQSPPAAPDWARSATGLRLALFSGNYNCVRDGANNALNKLSQYALDGGAAVRVYSPTTTAPTAFPPVGDLVSVPSIAIPRRPEYRLATGMGKRIREDVRNFAPTMVHLSAPDILGQRAQKFARELGVPVVASLHTRFETYLSYYGLGALRPTAERWLKKFYQNCDLVLVPNAPLAEALGEWGLEGKVRVWGRGVDREFFSTEHRDMAWRRSLGFADDDLVPLFFGRLVVEKGLDVFAAVIAELRERGHRLRPLIVGAGPGGSRFAEQLGDAVFTGHLEGNDLARAVASADIVINPSETEAFGNVNLEAMAAGLVVVSADVASAQALIVDGQTGLLVPPRDTDAYVRAIEGLIADPVRRRNMALAASAASADHDWPATLQAVIDAYADAGGIPVFPPPKLAHG